MKDRKANLWSQYICIASTAFIFVFPGRVVFACPLCDATSSTLSEDIAGSQLAVIGESLGLKNPAEGTVANRQDLPMTRFRIIESLNNKPPSIELTKQLQSEYEVYSNDPIDAKTKSLLFAYSVDPIEWGIPLPLTLEALSYLRGIRDLQDDGVARLRYFLNYLDSKDALVNEDAYNEFARAPIELVRAIAPELDRNRLISWIQDSSARPRLRGLYWMFLSLVGTQDDLAFCREMLFKIDTSQPNPPIDLPANIACFIALGGEVALQEIDQRFLEADSASTSVVHAAISAIRVVEQDLHTLPRTRLAKSIQHVLTREDLADFVIPDLARWEDWTAIDRLDQLFYSSDPESSFVRIPIINYMRICPLPKAKELLQKMQVADPNAAKRAEMLFGFELPK